MFSGRRNMTCVVKMKTKKVFQSVSFLLILFFLIGWGIPDPYGDCYEKALVYQYDYYRSLRGGKIVLIGGSSLSFGLDLDLFEELTGRPCAILGNHTGYGLSYHIEMSKSNLQTSSFWSFSTNKWVSEI